MPDRSCTTSRQKQAESGESRYRESSSKSGVVVVDDDDDGGGDVKASWKDGASSKVAASLAVELLEAELHRSAAVLLLKFLDPP